MFNLGMSYPECVSALLGVQKQGRLLSVYEIECLNHSFSHNHFLERLLHLYPLTQSMQKLYRDSLQHIMAQHPQRHQNHNYDVHNPIYAGVRAQVQAHLEAHFTPPPDNDIIQMLRKFWTEMSEKPETDKLLMKAEHDRYCERLREIYKKHDPSFDENKDFIEQKHRIDSLESIKLDFNAYLNHLALLKRQGSTYGWSVLGALFERIRQSEGQEKDDAQQLLLSTLDDCRTGYHLFKQQYVAGKNYTCPAGFEERLLGAHAFLIPSQKMPLSHEDSLILGMMSCFVRPPVSDDDLLGELEHLEVKRFFSPEIYQIYLQAAGYFKKRASYRIYTLRQDIDKQALIREYQKIKNDHLLSRFEKQQITQSIQNALHNFELPTESVLSDAEMFLVQHHAFDITETTKEIVAAPLTKLSREQILQNMADIGGFIDAAHVEIGLSLMCDHNPLEVFEEYYLSGAFEEHKNDINKGQEERRLYLNLYQEYIESQPSNLYYPFSTEGMLEELMKRPSFLSYSQEALCVFLSSQSSYSLGRQNIIKLAVLCTKHGYDRCISLLCHKHGLIPNLYDRDEQSTLVFMASQYGHSAVLEVLIKEGANVDSNIIKLGRFFVFDTRQSSLIEASALGHTHIVSVLLSAGAQVNIQNRCGETALMLSSLRGHADIVQILLAAGASPNIKEHINHRTALMYACAYNQQNIADMILQAGAYLDAQDASGATALMLAVFNSTAPLQEKLLQAGANLSVTCKNGDTVLMKACSLSRNTAFVEKLLLAGADIYARNHDGETALMIAAKSGCIRTVEVLIKAGSPIDARNNQGETAFMLAYKMRCVVRSCHIILKILKKARTLQQQSAEFFDIVLSGEASLLDSSLKADTVVSSLYSFSYMHFGTALFFDYSKYRGYQKFHGKNALEIAIEQGFNNVILKLIHHPNLSPCIIIAAIKMCIENHEYHPILSLLFERDDVVRSIIRHHHFGPGVLAWAAYHQSAEAVSVFLQSGADPIYTYKSKTALEYAHSFSNTRIIRILKKNKEEQIPREQSLLFTTPVLPSEPRNISSNMSNK